MTDLAGKKIAYFGYTGHIEPGGVTKIAAAFNHAVNNHYDEVYLCLSSHGGMIADGIYLYNHIRGLPLKVVAHNTGSVSSIAVAVFLAAEERYCSAHAMFMIHPTSMSGGGTTWNQLQGSLNAALADDQRTEDILRQRANIPDDTLRDRRFHDVYFTPDDAIKYGLVHGVKEFSLPSGIEIIQI